MSVSEPMPPRPLSPADMDQLVERLRPAVRELCMRNPESTTGPELCLRQAVCEFAGSRVQSFVPLLTLRQVRACLLAQDCAATEF